MSAPDGVDRLPRPMALPRAERPLRILFVYGRLPLPMTRGDELTVAHLLEFLHARGHAVDFVTLDAGQRLAPAHRAWLESRCRRLVTKRAMLAAGVAMVPIPGLDWVTDIGVLAKRFEDHY
mgnify:CR=1 FL=1